MYTKSKYNYRIENAISKLKIQCKHALIPTECTKTFYSKRKKKKVKPHGSTQDTTLKITTFRQNRQN